jgi:hypothetical protein
MNSSLRLSTLIAATALLAACGGGGGDTAPAPAPTPPTGTNPPVTQPPPPPAPVNDAEQYKGYLGASLGIVLGIDHVAKSMYDLPAKIRANVEQHGPTTKCSHSACPPDADTSQWATYPVENGTVRLQEWEEIVLKDGLLGGDEHLVLDVAGVGIPTISSTMHLYTPGATGVMSLMFLANYEATRNGLQINGDASMELTGALGVKLTAEGKYELRDRPVTETEATRQLIITETDATGKNSWLVNYIATTNAMNLDAVTFDVDMLNAIGGGNLRLKTETALDFGTINGRMVLEEGAFTYENTVGSTHVILRTTVDADPAFLRVEIDENADGTYEKFGRLAQEDINF